MPSMSLEKLIGHPLGRPVAVAAAAAAVALFAGCGGDDGDSGSAGSGAAKPITTATTGAEIFKSSTCTSCHTLADAGSKGNIGPNLDEEKPSSAEVVKFVTDGDGSMPSFKNRLSAEQIQAVADYVDEVTGE